MMAFYSQDAYYIQGWKKLLYRRVIRVVVRSSVSALESLTSYKFVTLMWPFQERFERKENMKNKKNEVKFASFFVLFSKSDVFECKFMLSRQMNELSFRGNDYKYFLCLIRNMRETKYIYLINWSNWFHFWFSWNEKSCEARVESLAWEWIGDGNIKDLYWKVEKG